MMKNKVIRMNPFAGSVKSSEAKNIICNTANPKKMRESAAGNKSRTVLQPGSLNDHNVHNITEEIKMNVAKSNKNEVIQYVDTFNPLTSCNILACDSLSLI